MSILLTQACQT